MILYNIFKYGYDFNMEMIIMAQAKCKDPTLKKLTLSAWAKILLNNGMIDIKKYNRMITRINKLTQ